MRFGLQMRHKNGEDGGYVHVKCSAHKHHLRSQRALKAARPYRLYMHGSKNGLEGGGVTVSVKTRVSTSLHGTWKCSSGSI